LKQVKQPASAILSDSPSAHLVTHFQTRLFKVQFFFFFEKQVQLF